MYYGKIDSTKVDTVCLDFASLYEAADVQSMENSAVEYTRRLVLRDLKRLMRTPTSILTKSTPFDEHRGSCSNARSMCQGSWVRFSISATLTGFRPEQKLHPLLFDLQLGRIFKRLLEYFDRMNGSH